jgi:hypothetical protein
MAGCWANAEKKPVEDAASIASAKIATEAASLPLLAIVGREKII